MRHVPLLLLFPLLLSSCFEDPSRVSFAPSNDPARPSFLRNGDLILENTFTAPLSTYVRPTDAEDLAARISRREPFFVYLTSLGCAHCQKAKDAVCSFLEQTELEFLHLEGNAIRQELDALQALLPDLEIPKTPGTPYLLRFDGEAFSLRGVTDAASSPRAFGERVLSDANLSLTYTFATAQGFFAHELDHYYFTGDKDPYLAKIQTEQCRYSLKEFGIVNLDALSASESALLRARLPEARVGTLQLGAKSYALETQEQEALEAFANYLE